jgi:hypothetical protein
VTYASERVTSHLLKRRAERKKEREGASVLSSLWGVLGTGTGGGKMHFRRHRGLFMTQDISFS